MEKIFDYIEKATGENNLKNRAWKDVVDHVILPKMAGPQGTRWCINDSFMNFVAEFAYDLRMIDNYTATAMFEIALQRLSCGAVLHESTPWPQPLPKEYWEYSSKWDEAHIMTEGCYNFICKAMHFCLENEVTESHAQKILFGLTDHISPSGEIAHSYYALNLSKDKAAGLYRHAERLLEEYATFDELYSHYAQPDRWEKHKFWFAQNLQKLDWKKFFADTRIGENEKNPVKRWMKKRSAKNLIVRLSMPAATGW